MKIIMQIKYQDGLIFDQIKSKVRWLIVVEIEQIISAAVWGNPIRFHILSQIADDGP